MKLVQSYITPASPPRAEGPELVEGLWTFQCLGLQLVGMAQIGDPQHPLQISPVMPPSRSPVGMGWRMGWVQVNAQEWNWALYRNAPGQPATLMEWPRYCGIDNEDRYANDLFYVVKRPFYQLLGPTQPLGIITFTDMPLEKYQPTINGAGGPMALASIGLKLSFVCALVVRDPDDAVYVLRWVPWYVQWSCDFVASPAGLQPRKVEAGTKAGLGNVQTAVPRVLTDALKNYRGKTANSLADQAPGSRILNGPNVEAELRRLRSLG